MNQEQPIKREREREDEDEDEDEDEEDEEIRKQEPIKYGTVFEVSGELADKVIAPGDATMMRTAEATVLGQAPPGGAGAAMQSAANINVDAGVVTPKEVTDIAAKRGVTVTETDVPGRRLITESVAGQVVGQYVVQSKRGGGSQPGGSGEAGGYPQSVLLTFGEALEAVLQSSGNKPVDMCDAAAIKAVEFSLTGMHVMTPTGLAATAQSAAASNQGIIGDENKVKLKDILTGAAGKLVEDRAVKREDAEAVAQAEIRNSRNMTIHQGGVAASMAAAVRLNERAQSST